MDTASDKALQRFAELMIEKIQQVEDNWQQPWFSTKGGGLPQNIDGRNYNGVNSFMLFLLTEKEQYGMPVYMTFMQAKEKGLNVLKGEHSFPVVYWNFSIKDKNGKKITMDQYRHLSREEQENYKVTPYMKTYNVFNVNQTNLKEVKPELYEQLENRFKSPARSSTGIPATTVTSAGPSSPTRASCPSSGTTYLKPTVCRYCFIIVKPKQKMKDEPNNKKHLTPRQIINRYRKGVYVDESIEVISSVISSCGQTFDSIAVAFPTTLAEKVLDNLTTVQLLYERQAAGQPIDDIVIEDYPRLKDILQDLSSPLYGIPCTRIRRTTTLWTY